MIRLLFMLLLAYIGYRIVKAMLAGSDRSTEQSRGPEAAATYRDPVCGVYVPEDDAVVGTLDGRRHYFCSMACLEKFRDQLDHKPS